MSTVITAAVQQTAINSLFVPSPLAWWWERGAGNGRWGTGKRRWSVSAFWIISGLTDRQRHWHSTGEWMYGVSDLLSTCQSHSRPEVILQNFKTLSSLKLAVIWLTGVGGITDSIRVSTQYHVCCILDVNCLIMLSQVTHAKPCYADRDIM